MPQKKDISSGHVVQCACLIGLLTATAGVWYRRSDLFDQLAGRATGESLGQVARTAREVLDHSQPKAPGGGSPREIGEPATVGELLGIGFDLAHELSKAGNDMLDDLAGISTADELRIGSEVHRTIMVRARSSSDAAETQRLEQLASPFMQARHRQDIPYRFTVIEDEQINAFAHLGGYVYVNRGLLRIADDDALRFVLGHEIAHCDLRHCVKNMTAVVRAGELAGDMAGSLASIAYHAIALGYSEDCEFEADAWSYQQIRIAGITHLRAMAGLNMLEKHASGKTNHHGQAPTGSAPPMVFEHLAKHFRSHPPIAERQSRLEELRRKN